MADTKKWGWARTRAVRGQRKNGVQQVSAESSGSGVWAGGGEAPASRLLQGWGMRLEIVQWRVARQGLPSQ